MLKSLQSLLSIWRQTAMKQDLLIGIFLLGASVRQSKSTQKSPSNLIHVRLEGEKVIKDSKMDITELGNFLLNFQSTINSFLEVKPNKNKIINKGIKEMTKLYLKGLSPGSVILNMETSPQSSIGGQNYIGKAYSELVGLASKINNNPALARKELASRFINSSDRLRVETRIQQLYTQNYRVGFEVNTGYLYAKQQRYDVIGKWIEEDSAKGIEEIRGIIYRIRMDRPYYFTVITQKGNQVVQCDYNKELEESVIGLIAKPVIVSGIMQRKVRKLELKDLITVKPWSKEEVNSIGNFRLNRPLELDIDYEDEMYCLKSNELNSVGCGYNYHSALKSLEEDIKDNLYVLTELNKDANLSKKERELRDNLFRYINNQDIRGIKWED